jgi:hypothetical protein
MSKREQERRGCCLPNFLGCCLGFILLLVCVLGIPGLLIGYATSGGPEPLDENYEADEAEAVAYENRFSSAVQQSRGGESFTVNFNEDEFASWLNLEFKERMAEELGIKQFADDLEFQADFDNGEVKVFSGFNIWESMGLHLNSVAVMELAPAPADAPTSQKLDVTVTEFRIGRADATEGFQTDLTDAINEAMIELLKPIQQREGFDYRITSVSVDNGQISFDGEVYALP